MTAERWRTLLAALTEVEAVDPADSGVLAFGSPPEGGIFVEKGRICWVAARGLQHRLRDLLRARARDRQADIDRVYERCRMQGLLFGQTLVTEGVIEPAELETVLRRHSAESLARLSTPDAMLRWASRGGRGYASEFTFRATDVLFDVVELAHAGAREHAAHALAPFASRTGSAAAFLLEEGSLEPVPLFAKGAESTLCALLTLGRWAASVPSATRELATSPRFTLAATAAGDTVSVWWHGTLLYAVVCEDRSAVAEVTAHHLSPG